MLSFINRQSNRSYQLVKYLDESKTLVVAKDLSSGHLVGLNMNNVNKVGQW